MSLRLYNVKFRSYGSIEQVIEVSSAPAQLLREHVDRYAALMAQEMGKPAQDGRSFLF